MYKDPNVIAYDLKIVSRNYSALRQIHDKWRTDEYGALSACMMTYRSSIKRSPGFFNSFLEFWNIINPFKLKGISKSLYFAVTDYIYQEFCKIDDSQRPGLIKQDLEVDFKGRNSLTFCEMFDSMFELVDKLSKTKLVSDYIRIVQSISEKIQSDEILKYFNLSGKMHLTDSPRGSYHKWMLNILHRKEQKSGKRAKPVKTPKLLSRPSKKSSLKDATLKKIRKMIDFSQQKTRQRSHTPALPNIKVSHKRKFSIV